MPIGVDVSRVKAKCGIETSDFDVTINALISEQVPALDYAVEPTILADTTPGLVLTLNLAATEIVCGEFLAQLARRPGAMETIKIGDVSLEPFKIEASKAIDIGAQGWARLRPYLRKDVGVLSTIVGAAWGKQGEDS